MRINRFFFYTLGVQSIHTKKTTDVSLYIETTLLAMDTDDICLWAVKCCVCTCASHTQYKRYRTRFRYSYSVQQSVFFSLCLFSLPYIYIYTVKVCTHTGPLAILILYKRRATAHTHTVHASRAFAVYIIIFDGKSRAVDKFCLRFARIIIICRARPSRDVAASGPSLLSHGHYFRAPKSTVRQSFKIYTRTENRVLFATTTIHFPCSRGFRRHVHDAYVTIRCAVHVFHKTRRTRDIFPRQMNGIFLYFSSRYRRIRWKAMAPSKRKIKRRLNNVLKFTSRRRQQIHAKSLVTIPVEYYEVSIAIFFFGYFDFTSKFVLQ